MYKVLLIEDNRALSEMGKAVLEENCDCEVIVADSRKKTQELLAKKNHNFSSAIVDLNLPDAHTGEVLPDVLAAKVPAIVLTGAYGEGLRKQMLEFGVVDYVVKSGMSSYQYVSDLITRIQSNKSTTALIVTSSLPFSKQLAGHLQLQKLKTMTTNKAEQAARLIQTNKHIRLVFVDQDLSDMSGFELVQSIRSTHGKDQLAIIGLSRKTDDHPSIRFLKNGANDFLPTEYDYEELLYRINQNLGTLDQIEMIRDAANRDYLTKMHNRRYFFKEGQQKYDLALKQKSPLCVAMSDIDFFKKINDKHGHDGGDAALRHIALLFTQHFDKQLIARFGGEEFCIMLPMEKEQAREMLDEFRKIIEKTAVDREGFHFSFTISIGMSCDMGESIDDMLTKADQALYEAKENGRNQLCLFSYLTENISSDNSMVRQAQR